MVDPEAPSGRPDGRPDGNRFGLLLKGALEIPADTLGRCDLGEGLVTINHRAAGLGELVEAPHHVEEGELSDISGEPRIDTAFDHGLDQGAGFHHGLVYGVFGGLEAAGDPDPDMSILHNLNS
tara:strand:- start:647 stop:1015 length:369 start_codon:yes stop_codon:yes gene_type:complete